MPNMSAVKALMDSQTASAQRTLLSTGRHYSGQLSRTNQQRANEATQSSVMKTRSISEAAFRVQIQGSQPSIQPNLGSLSPALQTYMRISAA